MRPLVARSRSESGQAVILGLFMLLVFITLAVVFVDGYALVEARNWGYQVAQQAALAGVSAGRDWASSENGCLELDETIARDQTEWILGSELALRGITGYTYEVRVLPEASGGSYSDFPPQTVRLGEARGGWTEQAPSVGVFLTFPMNTFLMSFVGRSTVPIAVFAAASVAEPAGVCKP
jgi:hypothetical protein